VLETGRLLLRPWRAADAVVQRELWTERDPQVPPHRRIDADGHPTVAELEQSIRTTHPSSIGLLAVERKVARDVSRRSDRVDPFASSRVEQQEARAFYQRPDTDARSR